ncbi:MAG: hypothetical protein K2Q26_10995 [Bdellovibrionales bacterium]|nr:hypothetical protein [Bdellovibrionales bacterium]
MATTTMGSRQVRNRNTTKYWIIGAVLALILAVATLLVARPVGDVAMNSAATPLDTPAPTEDLNMRNGIQEGENLPAPKTEAVPAPEATPTQAQ